MPVKEGCKPGQKVFVNVEVFQGIIHDVNVFCHEKTANTEKKKFLKEYYGGSEKKMEDEMEHGMPNNEFFQYETKIRW